MNSENLSNCNSSVGSNAETTMKQKTIWVTFLTSIFLTSCFGLFDSGSNRIIGKYIVLWLDLPLTHKQFDNLRTKLKIENISFDKVYPNKPMSLT